MDFACLHFRRGDFKDYCSQLLEEQRHPDTARDWVKSNFNFTTCWPDQHTVTETMDANIPLSWTTYVATEEDGRDEIEQMGIARTRPIKYMSDVIRVR
jgi:hypothetical protein